MINALIVHSSGLNTNRENGSSAGNLFWSRKNREIHTGAAFLNHYDFSRKRRVVYVMTQDESSYSIKCENQGGTADKDYSSLVVRLRGIFYVSFLMISQRQAGIERLFHDALSGGV